MDNLSWNAHSRCSGVRPFGVSLLIAGWDKLSGYQLFQVDPSGSYWAWKASSIGKGMVNSRTFLEKRFKDSLGLQDAVHTAILTMKEGFEGEMTPRNIEIGVVQKTTVNGKESVRFRVLSASELRDILDLE